MTERLEESSGMMDDGQREMSHEAKLQAILRTVGPLTGYRHDSIDQVIDATRKLAAACETIGRIYAELGRVFAAAVETMEEERAARLAHGVESGRVGYDARERLVPGQGEGGSG